MTERGVLFTPENYTKSEQGTKTQTRRILKVQPKTAGAILWFREMVEERGTWLYNGQTFKCPFGTVGDRLYVKEAHAIMSIEGSTVGVAYKNRLPKGKTLADTDGGLDLIKVDDETLRWAILKADSDRWRSPLFMPKWAARLWLEITEVRVERLQEISAEDIKAEGVDVSDEPETKDIYMQRWRHLWTSINGKGSWERNDWLWVISYKKVKP